MKMMKACVLHGINDLKYQEYPVPELNSGEVLFKVRACGICGSDIPRIFKTGTYHFPTIPGHEFSGEVVAVADKKNNHLIGMRAAVFPLIPCNHCPSCNKGIYETCQNYNYLGSRCNGGFAQYVSVPVWNLVPIPESLSFEEAAMAEPVSVALHAVNKATITSKDVVVVFGLGPIGILIAQWAKVYGAKKILLIGTNSTNYKIIEDLGFTDYFNISNGDPIEWVLEKTNGNGANIAFEAVGISSTACNCLECVTLGGKIVLVGNPNADFIFPKNTYWKILRKQLTIFGTWNSRYNSTLQNDWTTAINALTSGNIDVKNLITHRFNLEHMNQGLQIMKDKKEFYSKIIINCN